MKPAHWRKVRRYAPRSGAALCLGIFLLLQAMVAFPAFHAWIHHDANEAGHQCAVTLFTHGLASSSSTITELVGICPLVSTLRAPAAEDFFSLDLRFLPCRGPPADFCLS
jgi:hypothetical protein